MQIASLQEAVIEAAEIAIMEGGNSRRYLRKVEPVYVLEYTNPNNESDIQYFVHISNNWSHRKGMVRLLTLRG